MGIQSKATQSHVAVGAIILLALGLLASVQFLPVHAATTQLVQRGVGDQGFASDIS